MTVKEYFSKSVFNAAQAQVIGQELEQLARMRKSTAADIVSAAAPTNAPLHEFFEWDDRAAAREHRLGQARRMVEHIMVRSINPKTGETREQRAFYAVTAGAPKASPFAKGLKSYVTIEQVRERPDFRSEVLSEAKRQLVSWRDRYLEYEEVFAPVFQAIDGLNQEEAAA